MRDLPILVYDSDCGFCTQCVRLVERMPVDAEIVAWQLTDLAELGISQQDAADAVQWVDRDGRVAGGHLAVAAVLRDAGGVWAVLGRLIELPGVSRLGGRLYRLIAANRHRLPGGTPACALPADRRPGARTGC